MTDIEMSVILTFECQICTIDICPTSLMLGVASLPHPETVSAQKALILPNKSYRPALQAAGSVTGTASDNNEHGAPETCLNVVHGPLPIRLYRNGLTKGNTNRANAYCIGISHAGCGCCNAVLFYQFWVIPCQIDQEKHRPLLISLKFGIHATPSK